MRKKILLLTILFTGMLSAQTLTFTDPILKAILVNGGTANFTAYSGGVAITRIDTNFDNQIQTSEAALIDKLWIEGVNAYGITSIEGIEGFTNVTELGFNGISVTAINLSGMPNMKTFYCSSPTLVTANFSAINGMTDLTLMKNPLMTTLTVTNCASLEKIIAQENNIFSTLNVSSLNALTELYLADNQLTALDFTGCPNVYTFNASNNKLENIKLSGLTKLVTFNIENNPDITSIDASGCSLLNIPASIFTQNQDLITADFSNCSSLQRLSIPDNKLTTLNISGCSALTDLDVKNNEISLLDFSDCTALQQLEVSNNKLTVLDLNTCPNLINLRANDNLISNVITGNCIHLEAVYLNTNKLINVHFSEKTKLQTVDIANNPIIGLTLTDCTALTNVNCANTTISYADLMRCSALTSISITSPYLDSVRLDGCTALTSINLSGNPSEIASMSMLNVSGLSNLKLLNCGYTSINALDLTGCAALENLFCFNAPLTTLNYADSPNLKVLNLNNTKLKTIDVSGLANFESLSVTGNTDLETVFAKNGINENLFFDNLNTSLKFVCQDENHLQTTKAYLESLGLTTTVVNSYCTINPGGNYNTITGTISFDIDNNGCTASDAKQPNVKIALNDGTIQSETFTNTAGSYTFYTDLGSFNLNPHLENPTLFTISPETPTITFTDNNNHTTIQDFCIKAAGTLSDVEIVIAPIAPAKPGFMAWYQIVIKNKGNQSANGNFSFSYNARVLHYGLATQAPDSQSAGIMTWNYTDLLPFESKSYYVGLNVNTSAQVPPANLGDILNFTATINPIAGDFNAVDNVFNYNEVVVGSFDPNDITCLEGKTAAPSTIGDYLHYIINFENTGTAEAENIVVKVVIDESKYDINSLQLLNTSHPSQTIIHGNLAEFVFPNIFLKAVKNPPVGGHGNILFKIKTASDLVTNDGVGKTASIFFDYNAPIETSRAETIFKSLGTKEYSVDQSVVIYPNPTKGNVNISCNNTIKYIELFDVQGRILQTAIENNNSAKLDLSNKTNGLYFIRITTENGRKVEKLIKE